MKKLLMVVFMMFCGVAYADTETINWYVDGNVYNTTTCQTGGNVTLPTQPSKPGYTFVGWVVALYDFSSLDPDIGADSYTQSVANMTWTATFSYGTVLGQALCSKTSGTYPKTGTPDESGTGSTRYCWCKATGYTPLGDDKIYENTSSSAWVFRIDSNSASTCASDCPNRCGRYFQVYAEFRRALFGITQ